MPTAILRPTAEGDSFTMNLGAGADVISAIDPGDPVSHDDNSSYVTGDQNQIAEFELGSMPGDAIGVRKVRGFFRWDTGEANQTYRMQMKLNGDLAPASDDVQASATPTYVTVEIDPLPRPNGGIWTLDDLANATLQGRITCVTNPITQLNRLTSAWLAVDYDAGQVPQEGHREVAARRIRTLGHSPGVTRVRVPLHHLQMDLTDAVRLASDDIERAEEYLDSLEEHGLVTNWRSQWSAVIGVTLNFAFPGTLDIDLLNMEPILATAADTLAQPIPVTPDASVSESGLKRFGQAIVNLGFNRTEERQSVGFIVAADELNNVVHLVTVLDGVAKMNHRGMLAEDAFTNEVNNSAFIDDLDGYTTNLGTGGAIAIDSSQAPLFKEAKHGQQVVKITKGSSGDVELTRADVGSSTGDRRFSFHGKAGVVTAAQWWYQRNGSSPNYWRESDATWQTSKTWNVSALDSDGQWTRVVSKRMTGLTSGNASFGIGMSTGLEDNSFYVGQIQAVEKGEITSDAITDNNGNQIGGAADRNWDEKDNGGASEDQVIHPERYSVPFILHCYQDTDGITEGVANRHVLWIARWDDDDERDECSIEKVSGQVRIALRRFIGGSEDALAFKNISIAPGTEIEVMARATSPSDGELGLAARTLSVLADGVKGTDDQASDVHDTSAEVTQLYYGSPPSGLSLKRAANFIRNLEAKQIAVPDSAALGRR